MGWLNGELVRTHHGPRKHAQELVELLRADHAGPDVPATALAEIARLTRVAWGADRNAMTARQELVSLRARVVAAETALENSEDRLQHAERLLATSRAQIGLTVGRAFDRVRRKG
jgi:hypothetical protein